MEALLVLALILNLLSLFFILNSLGDFSADRHTSNITSSLMVLFGRIFPYVIGLILILSGRLKEQS